MELRLKGKKALVTGASAGIGLAIMGSALAISIGGAGAALAATDHADTPGEPRTEPIATTRVTPNRSTHGCSSGGTPCEVS